MENHRSSAENGRNEICGAPLMYGTSDPTEVVPGVNGPFGKWSEYSRGFEPHQRSGVV